MDKKRLILRVVFCSLFLLFLVFVVYLERINESNDNKLNIAKENACNEIGMTYGGGDYCLTETEAYKVLFDCEDLECRAYILKE